MEARNPYAVSSATLHLDPDAAAPSNGEDVWRDGKVLVMKPGAELPYRCVKCGGPCEHPIKQRKLYWHHWAVYLLLLVYVVVYVVVGLLVRKKAIVGPGLCRRHRAKRQLAIGLGWTSIFAGIGLIFAGVGNRIGEFTGTGVLMIAAGILVGKVLGAVVRAERIDNEYVRLRGCAPAFLDLLPPFRG